MNIRAAATTADAKRCLPALLTLRPHLDPDAALAQLRQQRQEGYILAFVEPDDDDPAPAVIGYRYVHFLHSGKTLYIDDLSTLPDARKLGFASALLDYVIAEAQAEGCQTVSLDSGHGNTRYDAHRLYLNKGFNIVSHHFAMTL